jgi:hypothetical protein
MQNSEEHEEYVPSYIYVCYFSACTPALCTTGEKYHSGTEEHGKDGAHFALEEHPLDKEHEEVQMRMWTVKVVDRCAVWDLPYRLCIAEAVDVNYENTEQSNSAKDIDSKDAVGCG